MVSLRVYFNQAQILIDCNRIPNSWYYKEYWRDYKGISPRPIYQISTIYCLIEDLWNIMWIQRINRGKGLLELKAVEAAGVLSPENNMESKPPVPAISRGITKV